MKWVATIWFLYARPSTLWKSLTKWFALSLSSGPSSLSSSTPCSCGRWMLNIFVMLCRIPHAVMILLTRSGLCRILTWRMWNRFLSSSIVLSPVVLIHLCDLNYIIQNYEREVKWLVISDASSNENIRIFTEVRWGRAKILIRNLDKPQKKIIPQKSG